MKLTWKKMLQAAVLAVLMAAFGVGLAGCGQKTEEVGGELVFAIFWASKSTTSASDNLSKSVEKIRLNDGEEKVFELPYVVKDQGWFEYGLYYSPEVPGHFTPFNKDLVYSYSDIEWDFQVMKLNEGGEEVKEEDFTFNSRKTKEQMLGTHVFYFDYFGCEWGNLKFKPIKTKLTLKIYESIPRG